MRDPSVVDDALRGFVGGDNEYTALLSVHKMSESSYKTFEMEDGKLKCLCDKGFDIESANLERQSFPVTYNANGYVDVIRSELVQSCGKVHGDSVKAYVTETTYEVDEPREFDFLEHIIAKMPSYWASLFEKA